ncbi:hypothetical protein [Psychrobacter okhotskensis]|uniref:hypothetical protein n=2 Tax=Psychrobacter okhotskensis TaxID=212403 RepID=UPI003D011D8F
MTDLTTYSIGSRATVLASLPLSILLALAISGCSSESVDDNRDSVDTNNTSSHQPKANKSSANSALEQITALPFTKKTSQNGQQRPLSAFPVKTNNKQLQELLSRDYMKRAGFYQLPDKDDMQVFVIFHAYESESLELEDTSGLTIDQLEDQHSYLVTIKKTRTPNANDTVHIFELAENDFVIAKDYQQIINTYYDFNRQPIHYQLTDDGSVRADRSITNVTTLPFSSYDVDDAVQLDTNLVTSEFTMDDQVHAKQVTNKLKPVLGGASDRGFFKLPSIGDIEVFLAYGLFEDSGADYITDDNPEGMFVDPEYYLITVKDDNIAITHLGSTFTIEEDYQEISVVDKYFQITVTGKIVPVDERPKPTPPKARITQANYKHFFPSPLFASFHFDVNNDGKRDLLVAKNNSNGDSQQDDELYVYLAKGKYYELDLSSITFADAPSTLFSTITPRHNNKGFIVSTYWANSEKDYIKEYLFEQVGTEWWVTHGVLKSTVDTGEAYYCQSRTQYNATTDFARFDLDKEVDDDYKLQNCPIPPTSYKVISDKAEILNDNFMPNKPSSYFIKGDIIRQPDIFYGQNQDWVKVSYKDSLQSGWVRKRDLIGME